MMNGLRFVLTAGLAALSMSAPAFAQSFDRYGSPLPNHYEGEQLMWGSMYAPVPAATHRPVARSGRFLMQAPRRHGQISRSSHRATKG